MNFPMKLIAPVQRGDHTDFTFMVDGKSFVIRAKTKLNAFEAANCKVREDKLVKPDDSFAWFDGTKPNSFCLGHNVSLD